MTSETQEPTVSEASGAPEALHMPAPTYWPSVLAAAITLLGMGLVTNWLFSVVGAIVFIIALSYWLGQLLPGKGHLREELQPPELRAQPVRERLSAVEHLRAGMAGHRLRFPEKIHPYSAGVKGGMVGGLVMMVPAFIYGFVSGRSIWYPINLLAGLAINLPRLPDGSLDIHQLELFNFRWLFLATVIHIATSVSLGLMYGVLLPMLPGRAYFWGGLIAPLLWTGAIYGFMGVLNPALREAVNWPSFIVAQFIYGLVAGLVVVRTEKVYAERVGRFPPDARADALAIPPGEGNP